MSAEQESTVNRKYACIDLHLHLDGAVTCDIARRLATITERSIQKDSDGNYMMENHEEIILPENDDELKKLLTVDENCRDLNQFLECFSLPLSLMQTKENLSEAVRLVCDNILSQGIIYAEIRFAPQLHTRKSMDQEDAVLAALSGLSRTKLKANLILCCMRGEGNDEENDKTLELAKKYLVSDGGVVAIDLAGAESLYPTRKYRELFGKARALGIPFTIHAGEADGAESVRLAIEYGAARIGHGVRSYEDPQVLNLLMQKGITLEMCPTSNYMTHAIEDSQKYPFMDYLKKGIKVTLNTDDMGIEGTTLLKEFLRMEDEFGLDETMERQLFENAVDAAFTTDEVKDMLKKKVNVVRDHQ